MTDPTNQEMEELLALAKKRNQSIADDSNRSARKKAKASLGSSQSSNFNADQKDNDLASNYPYPVVPDDHCESPTEAYQDVASFLDAIAAQLGKTRKDLSIFDPYFCEGSMKERLQSLGFCNVRNEKKDFYQLIQTNTLPSFDVLVTNPPYSGDHMERLLRFCTGEQCRRPWFLLMPNYVYTKDYYSAIFGPSTAQARRTAPPPFYVTPVGSRRYLYSTPKGRRQEKSAKYTSPFPTFWYCQLYEKRESILSQAAAARVRASSTSTSTSSSTTQPAQGDRQDRGTAEGSGEETAKAPAPAPTAAKAPQTIVVALSALAIPLEHAPDNDPRKKKLRNNKKRSKNKMRQKGK